MNTRFWFLLVTVAGAGRVAWAYDAYDRKLDYEYKSLSNAISSAYSNNTPSYSSSSNYSYGSSSGRSYSSSSSSSYTPLYDAAAAQAVQKQKWERYQAELQQQAFFKQKWAEEERYEKAQREKRELAAAQARQEQLRQQWNNYRQSVGGKAAFLRPPQFTSRESELVYWTVEAKQKHDPFAAMSAGTMLLYGIGTLPDANSAYEMFALSNIEWPEVRFGLGVCQILGAGTPKDVATGIKNLAHAGNDDKFAPAARYLAGVYEAGKVVPRDLDAAFAWYRRAAWNGMEERKIDADEELIDFSIRHLPELTRFVDAVADDELGKHHPPFGADLEYNNWLYSYVAAVGRRAKETKNVEALYALMQANLKYGFNSRPATGRNALEVDELVAAADLGHAPSVLMLLTPDEKGVFYSLNLHKEANVKAWFETQRATWEASASTNPRSALALASYYAGALGNTPQLEEGSKWANALLASLPKAQRRAVYTALGRAYLINENMTEASRWLQREREAGDDAEDTTVSAVSKERLTTLLTAAFKVTTDNTTAKTNIDILAPLAAMSPATQAQAARDREAGVEILPMSESIGLTYLTRAAVAGDLPALARLYFITHSDNHSDWQTIFSGSTNDWQQALIARLEKAANEGDGAAAATLGEIYSLDKYASDGHFFGSTNPDLALQWFKRSAELNHPAGLLALAAAYDSPYLAQKPDPAQSESLWRAALAKRDLWQRDNRAWGFSRTSDLAQMAAEKVHAFDAQRAQLALEQRMKERHLELVRMLGALEKTPRVSKSPLQSIIADARYMRGGTYLGYVDVSVEAPPRDLAKALDDFIEAVDNGSPMAPLAIANYYAQGHDGFPKDAALARRWQLITDRRLSLLAAEGNDWAALTLGKMLVDDNSYTDPDRIEWLPTDFPRGIKYLEAAAWRGAVLPSSFGDSEGAPAAYGLAIAYRGINDNTRAAKWDKIGEWLEEAKTPAQKAAAMKKARAFMGLPPLPVKSAPKASPKTLTPKLKV